MTHTKDKLAAALREIGLEEMAELAAEGFYDDFLSPLATPCLQLVSDLTGVGTAEAKALAERAKNGEFDATKEESDEWAASEEGVRLFEAVVRELPASGNIGRLALRVEGEFWRAYYALPDTMRDSILLGSIHMRFVQTKERKDAFMDLMMEAVSDLIEERTGHRPKWGEPEPGPESERSGHG